MWDDKLPALEIVVRILGIFIITVLIGIPLAHGLAWLGMGPLYAGIVGAFVSIVFLSCLDAFIR